MGKKRPKKAGDVRDPQKRPKAGSYASSTDSEIISWHLNTIDREGPWGWDNVKLNTLWDRIHSKLCSFESMTWESVTRAGSHLISVSKICGGAQKRLRDINQDDTDDVFSLRLSGRERIIGIRAGAVLKILWWDPNHEVCPSNKKYT